VVSDPLDDWKNTPNVEYWAIIWGIIAGFVVMGLLLLGSIVSFARGWL
jgi:hypothetical protein